MKNVFRNVFLSIILIVPTYGSAGIHETLPTYHWSYAYIKELQMRGSCLDLGQLNKPYTRGEVARSLLKVQSSLPEDITVKGMFNKLTKEFDKEIIEIKNSDGGTHNSVTGRLFLKNDINKEYDDDPVNRGVYRGGVGAKIGKHLFVYSGINFDQYAYHDSNYVGDRWRSMTAYTEQAYMNFIWKQFTLKIGRDFLKWGAGENSTLVFSNIARPLDQFSMSLSFGPFRYSFITSQLDPYPVSKVDSTGQSMRRYLSGHRIDASFFNNKLQFSISEIIFYGGPGRTVDFTYLNPFIFYHGAHRNKGDETNVLPTLDVLFYPIRNINIYGSLLIDDIQIEKKIPGDLEPNEIAYLIGSRWADPIGISGMAISGEYVRVANRTYKTPVPWETLIHRNQPLGHSLGNDFDHFQVGISKWFSADLWCKLQYEHTRKGEGSIYTPWDAPWMKYSIDQGYSEPFPTGVVEKRDHLRFQFRYQPSIHWGIEGEVVSSQYHNYQHVKGADESKVQWRIGVWWDGKWEFTL